MLLQEKQVSVQATGMKETTTFKAKLDGMMFDNLINGIYSNKIGAGIREYATNARDGHARRGNLDRPFEVGLPNKDKAFFEVRDFGSSLTHEEVFEIFAVLGESTKRDTNDETGCLGLGSKSAFAYTNAFSVTCWKDGRKRDYSCYIGEAGQPLVSLISEIKSNEEEGVRISYAVKQHDIADFNKEASKQLRGFDPQPKIIRSTPDYKPLTKDNLLIEGDGWKIYKATEQATFYNRAEGKPMAIQGSVAYPIDASNATLITAIRRESGNRYEAVLRMLRSTDILIRFDIGELRMTTSREELAYDEKTTTNLAKKFVKVLENVQKTLDEEYAACKTLKEARMLRSKSLESNLTDLERTLNINTRHWNGIVLNHRMVFGQGEQQQKIGEFKDGNRESRYYIQNGNEQKYEDFVVGSARLIEEYNYRNKFGEIKAQFQWPEATNKNARLYHSMNVADVSALPILFDIESLIKDKNKNSLMRNYWKNKLTGKSNFMWVKVNSIQDAKRFLEIIYHDDPSNVTYLHELTELKMPSKSKTKNSVTPNAANNLERRIRYVIGMHYAYSGGRADYELIDFSKITEKLPVIFFKNNEFYLTKADLDNEVHSMDKNSALRLINEWVERGKVYVINGQQLKFYEDNQKYFKDLKEWLIESWKKKHPTWEKEYAESQWQDDDADNDKYGKKFGYLFKKYHLTFKTINDELQKGQDKYINPASNYGYFKSSTATMPMRYRDWLEKDLEAAVKKHPQPAQKTGFIDFVNNDPILLFLMNQVSNWSLDEDHLNALKHYKKINNE